MKLGAFLKQYLKQSLQAFKHPKQLLPTIILTVVWMVLGILQIKLKENLPMQVLNFITYAQGGLYGGVVGAIGGILGKVVVAAFVNALLVPLFQGKKPFKGAGSGFKDLFKSISLQSRSAVAPLLKGFGAALLLYGLSNINGSAENSMAGIMAAVSLVLAMGKKSGTLWNFAFSYANSVSKGKAPSYQGVLRALTGMTLGFALGVGLNAAGIGLVGLIGIIALVLGWILGMGTKKEAVVSALLVVLTLIPAPEAQAAKKKVVGAWVLKEITVQTSERQKATLPSGREGDVSISAYYGMAEFKYTDDGQFSKTTMGFYHLGTSGMLYYPGEGFSTDLSISGDLPVSMECFVQGSTNPDYQQPESGEDGNYTFTFPSLQEVGSQEWTFVYKTLANSAEVYATYEYNFVWEEVEPGNWVLQDQKVINPGSLEYTIKEDWSRGKIFGLSYDAESGYYSYQEEVSEKVGWTQLDHPEDGDFHWESSSGNRTGVLPILKGPYHAGKQYLLPNEDITKEYSSPTLQSSNTWASHVNLFTFSIRFNGENKFTDRLNWRDYGKSGYKIIFPTHEAVGGDVLKVECILGLAGMELNHTYIFTWGGAKLDKDEKAALAGGEEEGDGGGDGEGYFSELIDRLQDLLDNGEHTDEEETILIDLIAALTAAGAAGAAGGGLPFGPDGGEPDGGEDGKSEEEKEWEKKQKEYDDWVNRMKDRYTRKNPDGTVTVIDPATGERSTLYPTEEGNYKNEDGNPVTDNDLANWLDDHERNSDYHRQNAATAERNLEKMRKDAADEQARVRRGEKSDMEKAWEKRKKEIEDARKKEEIGQKKDYYDQLADKYKLDKNSADLKKDIKKAILKERLKALEDLKDAEAKDDAYTKAMQFTKRVQAVCDISFAAIGTFGGTTGKTGQTIYVLLRNTLGRTSESYSKKDSLLKGATKGAVEGGLEVGVGLIDNPIVNTAAAGIKQAYSSWLDGDSLGDAAAKIATACALQGASNVIGNWVTSGQKSFVQDQWKLSYGDAPGAGAMYLEGVDNAVKVALTVGKGVKFVGETFVDLLGRYIEGDE